VGSEQIQLSIHSAVIERFPQPLREDLDISGRIQGEIANRREKYQFGNFCTLL
jgi:hypothetical protein